MNYNNYILLAADEAVKQVKLNGYMQPGHNGPYYDDETPIRNSAHWIVIFDYLYKKTNDTDYLECIKILAEYLYNKRPQGKLAAYHCRNKKGKDSVNGTIGAAWIIEGLICAAHVLDEDKYYNLAVDVFKKHEYSYILHVWNRVEIDGTVLGYDNTYNHQMWLAAAGAEIIKYQEDKEIKKQIEDFLSASEKTKLFQVSSKGVVRHFAYIADTQKHKKDYFKREIKEQLYRILKKPDMQYKEEGYHYFNMYGFAILYEVFNEHSFFSCDKLKRALKYTMNLENLNLLDSRSPKEDRTGLAQKYKPTTNLYAYGYNSPAFELPYIIKTFAPEKLTSDMIQNLWDSQVNATGNGSDLFAKNTEDAVTLQARMYELVRALS